MIVIDNLLSAAEISALRDAALDLPFGDGRATAGAHARAVKANDQALPCPELDAILGKVEQALAASPLFRSAARPKAVSKLILSRYRDGHTYGLHVDDALMQGLRTDLSFTLFLAEPDAYDGGALIVEDMFEARAIKLAAGEMILYPASTLHRVEPVGRGERLAVVGWVQSLIRDAAQREVLFDLDLVIEACFAEGGKTEVFDRLAKTRSNLLRMWAEI
ncbi:MAG: Fe2+-dependent dioxygenase [Cypionkella sp.]